MKHVIIMATAALALAGCQQSVDQRFKAMCKEQEANDPAAWSSSEAACRNADNLPTESKKVMLDAYAELQRARKAVEQ